MTVEEGAGKRCSECAGTTYRSFALTSVTVLPLYKNSRGLIPRTMQQNFWNPKVKQLWEVPSVSHTYSAVIPPNTRKTDNESRKATMNCQVIDLEKNLKQE